MDKTKIKTRKNKEDLKSEKISIRLSPKLSKWLSENEYSPTGIFQEACNDLGFKEE